MRCALKFDENKDLTDQSLAAWGEMQSLNEEPAYKEEDIKSPAEKEYFYGIKSAFDTVCSWLGDLVEDETVSEEASDELQAYMTGELAMQLFSILDNQEEESNE